MSEQIITIPRAIEGRMHGELKIDGQGISAAKMEDGDELTIHLTAFDSDKHSWTKWWKAQDQKTLRYRCDEDIAHQPQMMGR